MAQVSVTSGTVSSQSSAGGATKMLSHICFVGGFLSIAASIAIWMLYRPGEPGLGERSAIFVGLWPPTFFALSDRLARYAKPQSK